MFMIMISREVLLKFDWSSKKSQD